MTTLDQTYTILVVDDEPDLRALYQTTLQRSGYTVLCAESVAAAIACLKSTPDIACVLTDYQMPNATGIDLVHYIGREHAGLPVSLMTAYGSPDHAVQAMKAGAYDYLSKPVAITDLRALVVQMVAQNHLHQRKDPAALVKQMATILPGQSPAMKQVHQVMMQCTQSLACVAIDGQRGTGKELAARAIHSASLRSAAPFIVFNCTAHSSGESTTLEAALFDISTGAFQAAQGGTLLLEGLEALPQKAQLMLLSVLQERSIKPSRAATDAGHSKSIPIDVRLMVSSQTPLSHALTAGQLRQDLYYRINILALHIPALHERVANPETPDLSDAVWLAQRWLAQHPNGKLLTLSDAAIVTLNKHSFTGNVRELENILERSVALHSGKTSTSLDLVLIVATIDVSNATDAANSAVSHTGDGATGTVHFPLDLIAHLASIERSLIEQALQRCRFNRTQAATLLGLNLRQMRYRMEQLGIND